MQAQRWAWLVRSYVCSADCWHALMLRLLLPKTARQIQIGSIWPTSIKKASKGSDVISARLRHLPIEPHTTISLDRCPGSNLWSRLELSNFDTNQDNNTQSFKLLLTMSTKKTVAGSSKGPARKSVPQLTAPKQSKTAVYNGSVQMTHPIERDSKNLLHDEVDENAGGDDHAWSEASQGVRSFMISSPKMLTVGHSMETHHHNCIRCYWIPLSKPPWTLCCHRWYPTGKRLLGTPRNCPRFRSDQQHSTRMSGLLGRCVWLMSRVDWPRRRKNGRGHNEARVCFSTEAVCKSSCMPPLYRESRHNWVQWDEHSNCIFPRHLAISAYFFIIFIMLESHLMSGFKSCCFSTRKIPRLESEISKLLRFDFMITYCSP